MRHVKALIAVFVLGLFAAGSLGAQAPGTNPYGIDQALYLGLLGDWIAPSADPGVDAPQGTDAGGPTVLSKSGADLRFSLSRDERGLVTLDLFDGTSYRVAGLSVFDQACLRLDLVQDSPGEGEGPESLKPTILILFLDERHALLGDGSELDAGFFVEPDLPLFRLSGPGLP